jgi:hypothetical protein
MNNVCVSRSVTAVKQLKKSETLQDATARAPEDQELCP